MVKAKRERKPGPKRPTTAFFFFGADQRSGIKAEHPEWRVTDISKELGRRWKDLSDDDKAPFTELAAADKVRYEREKAEFEAKTAAAAGDDDAAAEEEEEED